MSSSNEYEILLNPSSHSENILTKPNNFLLTWSDLTYTLLPEPKKILKSVSGYAYSGQILSILGQSGSGKTTLLSLLAGRCQLQNNISVSGSVNLNNINIKTFPFSSISAYLEQETTQYNFLTTKETIEFVGSLKLDLPQTLVKKRAKKLMRDLHLTKVANSVVGDTIVKGLSGGEKKRLSLACELISNPSILILDEPLSGLDSYTAEIVMRYLRKLADSGKTIIMSVHQPSDLCFSLFDRVILMQNGRFAYQGHRSELSNYFSSLGCTCPVNVNPCEFYVKKLIIQNVNNLTEDERGFKKKIRKHYRENFREAGLADEIHLDFAGDYSAGFLTGFYWLIWRGIKGVIRNPSSLIVKLVNSLILGTLCALLYFNLGLDSKGVSDRAFLIRAIVGFNIHFPIVLVSLITASERVIVYKESYSKLYSIEAYIISKVIIESLFNVFFSLLMASITYYSADLNTNDCSKVLIMAAIVSLTGVNGVCIGLFAGSISYSIPTALFISDALVSTCSFFSGYYSSVGRIPSFFRWMKFTSVHYYSLQGLLKNEFDGLAVDADVNPAPDDIYHIEQEIETCVYLFFINIACFLIISYFIMKIRTAKSMY